MSRRRATALNSLMETTRRLPIPMLPESSRAQGRGSSSGGRTRHPSGPSCRCGCGKDPDAVDVMKVRWIVGDQRKAMRLRSGRDPCVVDGDGLLATCATDGSPLPADLEVDREHQVGLYARPQPVQSLSSPPGATGTFVQLADGHEGNGQPPPPKKDHVMKLIEGMKALRRLAGRRRTRRAPGRPG